MDLSRRGRLCCYSDQKLRRRSIKTDVRLQVFVALSRWNRELLGWQWPHLFHDTLVVLTPCPAHDSKQHFIFFGEWDPKLSLLHLVLGGRSKLSHSSPISECFGAKIGAFFWHPLWAGIPGGRYVVPLIYPRLAPGLQPHAVKKCWSNFKVASNHICSNS